MADCMFCSFRPVQHLVNTSLFRGIEVVVIVFKPSLLLLGEAHDPAVAVAETDAPVHVPGSYGDVSLFEDLTALHGHKALAGSQARGISFGAMGISPWLTLGV